MIDKSYFEQVLKEQLLLMEKAVRLTVHLTGGREYLVHALVAAHERFVILKVHSGTDGDKAPPFHSDEWLGEHPEEDRAIHDQVCVPYGAIIYTHLTAVGTVKHDRSIGFQAPR